MTYTYVFRNAKTGELRRQSSYALNDAARTLGIHRDGSLVQPWIMWECWRGSECVWHADENGKIESGPRKS